MSLIAASNITVRFGTNTVLDGVSFAAARGEAVGLIGPNGAGKTTLLRVVAGLHQADAGEVRIDGRPLASIAREDRARTVAYLPHGSPVHWPLNVARLVALGRLPHLNPWQRPSDADEAAIGRAIEAAEMAPFVGRTVTTLSAGERARAMLARALAVEPAALLADEPVTALDPYHQLRVMALLRERVRHGMTVVAVLHDLTLAARFCDRLVLLDAGRVAAEGAPAEVLTPAILAAVYGIAADYGGEGRSLYVVPREAVGRGPGEATP